MLGIYHGRHAQVHNRGINGQSSQTPAIPFRHFKRILFTIWKRDQRENNLCKYARGLIIINFFPIFVYMFIIRMFVLVSQKGTGL